MSQNRKVFVKLIEEDCIGNLYDLTFGKKVDHLMSAVYQGDPAILSYLDCLRLFVTCALGSVPDSVPQKANFLRSLERLRKRVSEKVTVSNKTIKKKDGLSTLRSDFTKLKRCLEKERYMVRICPKELGNKSLVHGVLWPS
jgi:hypothetical protein